VSNYGVTTGKVVGFALTVPWLTVTLSIPALAFVGTVKSI
jgi:hypothetical protein